MAAKARSLTVALNPQLSTRNMGDRCYMQITCRRQDQEHFEELGFHVEFDEDKNNPVIEMIDEEANYAHYENMPTDIPYYGSNAAGSNYGPGSLVCDGKEFAEVGATSDGFIVAWDYQTQQPTQRSLENIRRYLTLHATALKIFKTLRASKPKG